MSYDNIEPEFCQAFSQLLNTIHTLRMNEKNISNQNNSALEKCKNEVEALFNTAKNNRNKVPD